MKLVLQRVGSNDGKTDIFESDGRVEGAAVDGVLIDQAGPSLFLGGGRFGSRKALRDIFFVPGDEDRGVELFPNMGFFGCAGPCFESPVGVFTLACSSRMSWKFDAFFFASPTPPVGNGLVQAGDQEGRHSLGVRNASALLS